jgi:hypothetical protein
LDESTIYGNIYGNVITNSFARYEVMDIVEGIPEELVSVSEEIQILGIGI